MLAGQAATLAEGSQIPHRQANALYCRGLVDGDAVVLLEAAERFADAGRPLPQAKALEAAAACLVEIEDRTGARLAFEQAMEVYEFLGAEADLNRVQAEFRGYGIRRGTAQQAPAGAERLGVADRRRAQGRGVRRRGPLQPGHRRAAHAVAPHGCHPRLAHPEEA